MITTAKSILKSFRCVIIWLRLNNGRVCTVGLWVILFPFFTDFGYANNPDTEMWDADPTETLHVVKGGVANGVCEKINNGENVYLTNYTLEEYNSFDCIFGAPYYGSHDTHIIPLEDGSTTRTIVDDLWDKSGGIRKSPYPTPAPKPGLGVYKLIFFREDDDVTMKDTDDPTTVSGGNDGYTSSTVNIIVSQCEYKEGIKDSGFDDKEDPSWIVVAKNGSNTCSLNILPSANDSYTTSLNPNIATVTPESGGGTLTISGIAKGHTEILTGMRNIKSHYSWLAPIETTGTLHVCVKPEKNYYCHVVLLSDNFGHKTNITTSSIPTYFEDINRIWGIQANVTYHLVQTHNVVLPVNYGNTIDGNTTGTTELELIMNYTKSNYNIPADDTVIYYCWDMTSYNREAIPPRLVPVNGLGYMPGKDVFVNQNSYAPQITTAHELGHNRGLRDIKSPAWKIEELMWWQGSNDRGKKIYHSESDIANP